MPRALSDPGCWLVLLAALTLAAAYAGVCALAGSAWPFAAVVHEDGQRTLLLTVFYFEHASRELLLDLVLAVAVAAAATRTRRPAAAPEALRRRAAWLGGLALAGIGVILTGTLVVAGPGGLATNLAQMPTRIGEAPSWGAHWRYHLLSRLALLLLVSALAVVVARACRAPEPHATAGRRLSRLAWSAFALATLVFAPSLEPFRDPRFLGHQARELLTHALVTVPLALGVTLCALGRERFARIPTAGLPWGRALVLVLLAAYLGAGTLWSGSVSQGQSEDLRVLLWPHFFEHALGYLVVPCAAAWLALRSALGAAS